MQKKQSKVLVECHHCKEVIKKGAYVKASGMFFHSEHFLCEVCKQPPGKSYLEKEGKIYCTKDFMDLFANKCEVCKEPLNGKYLNVRDKNYHKECFVCSECHKPFEDLNFVNALQRNWHRECFKCKTCGEVFVDNKYKIMDGYPYHALCK